MYHKNCMGSQNNQITKALTVLESCCQFTKLQTPTSDKLLNGLYKRELHSAFICSPTIIFILSLFLLANGKSNGANPLRRSEQGGFSYF